VATLSKAQSIAIEPIGRKLVPAPARITPFLKWAGGKSQLLSTYSQFFPETYNNYFEPFIGGGAVFFHLKSSNRQLNATISDCNMELTNCYEVIRADVEGLIKALALHRNETEYFYAVRAQDPTKLSPVERAARLIFLNKTCFNGLYRVNRKGQFNVPFGRYENPKFCHPENLFAVSEALQDVQILNTTYDKAVSKARASDFVYFDPPYQPLSSTASFTSYTENSFGLADQQKLSALFGKLSGRGCKVMLSNSDNELVRRLYKEFRIETVRATRAINCKAERRGQISELLIMNY
jgi:DNA adenine methylase